MGELVQDAPVRLALHTGGQSEVFKALRRDAETRRWRNRFRVVVAGRRWGKTHDARVEHVSRALKFGPGRYWYIAPTLKAAKDIYWEDLKAIIDPTWLKDKSESE